MTLSPGKLPIGRQIFSDIIQKNMIYVDKTAILADLISGDPLVRFLSRPRRFGKSLTVSTLEAVFSGQKELFKGLAIEERLDEECFAPRPVIKLDLSLVHAGLGVEGLRKDLAELTDPLAVRLGVSQSVEDDPYSKKVSFNKTLVNLIEVCAKNSGRPVAVLIDEYDKPDLSFMRRSAEMEDAREVLRDYYTQLKAAEKDISLIFVTGISKFSRRGIFSVFNNVFDISIMPEFGAICGFTQQELESDFPGHIEETAQALRISPTELLDKMRDYYDGFCFDGVTRVYNPFSILQFFKVKKFDNFWFESGTSLYLAQYLRDKRLTVEQFRGLAVDREFARNPGEMDKATPESFLYQAGYLSLRPGNDPDSFTLDYPNREVLKSMSRLLLENIFGSLEKIRFLIRDLTLAFKSRDPAGVIQVFQEVLAPIPYDDYVAANRKTFESLYKVDYGEFLYRAVLLSFLDLIGLTPKAEVHSSRGRSDLEFTTNEGQVWVMELKICRKDGEDESLAEAALNQIIAKGYGDRHKNPVLLGVAINDNERAITAWRVKGLSTPNAR